jgi:hypothetical protein
MAIGRQLGLILGVALSTGIGCGGGTTDQRVCTPGASVACTCTNGKPGAQLCAVNGSSLGLCVCAGDTGTGGSPSSGGQSGAAGQAGKGGAAGQGGVAGQTGAAGQGGSPGSAGQGGRSGAPGSGGSDGGAGSAGLGGAAGSGGAPTSTCYSVDAGVAMADAGPFPPSQIFYQATTIGVADTDGDGIDDCIVTEPGSAPSTLDIVFHKGLAGNLCAGPGVVTPNAIPTQQSFTCQTSLDFNNDGRADLLCSGVASSVYFYAEMGGMSDGTFAPGIGRVPTGIVSSLTKVEASAAGDFNGDGRLDLLDIGVPISGGIKVVIFGVTGAFCGGGLTIIGNAGFNINVGPQGSVFGAASGDFNNDGKLDVAVNFHYINLGLMGVEPWNYFGVQIALGDGQGGFPSSFIVPGTTEASSFTVGDFNTDGNLDLDVSLITGTTVTDEILYGDGMGNFATTSP